MNAWEGPEWSAKRGTESLRRVSLPPSPRMLQVSSLVRVLVALRVALVTAFSAVEVLELDFLPVMADSTFSSILGGEL